MPFDSLFVTVQSVICYPQFYTNIFITFMIRHSVLCDRSKQTHFCRPYYSHLFLR